MGAVKCDDVNDNFSNLQLNSIVILNEFVKETENSAAVMLLFTKLVNHENLLQIYINQNFYYLLLTNLTIIMQAELKVGS